MSRFFLKLFNFLISIVLAACLLVSVAYAGYSLWDNSRIYSAVDDVQRDMIKLKPKAEEKDNGSSFSALQQVNPDVRAWLSVDNTNIDYPILQGESNLSYINTDVYGEFALSGSLFMDSRNAPDFSDKYILFYGHHMDGGKMFGDLDRFKEESFFEKEGSGLLILPDGSYELEVFATLVIKASERMIFDPVQWSRDAGGLIEAIDGKTLFLKDDLYRELKDKPDAKILALTTCTNEFTDARTVVLAVITPKQTAGMEE